MKKAPEQMTICSLTVLVMSNGEVICLGKTIGWVKELGKYLEPVSKEGHKGGTK